LNEPSGSDVASRRRPWLRRARRRFKSAAGWLARTLTPIVYVRYMDLVWRTSRHVDHGLAEIRALPATRRGFIALLWHEEVVAAPYVYGAVGLRSYALVSRSAAGDVAAALLLRTGHQVCRGGSSRRGSRRSTLVTREVIQHLEANPGTVLGVVVDGSAGPRYRMKPGSLLVARRTGLPIVLLRVWFRRSLRFPTWDRTALPLPWNEVHVYAEGPFASPADAGSREGRERWRRELENALIELAARSYREVGQPRPAALAPARDPRAAASDLGPSSPPAATTLAR
jgi:lysophospholipid acyltransferase (LPLAT)-like uncharacterized protein